MSDSLDAGPVRRQQLRAGLDVVRQRVARACAAAGRDVADVRLVVVTKTYPAADIAALAELEVVEVGENRDQEAAAKAADLDGRGLEWHFIGQLQSNKARSVLRYASCLHSVDRPGLVEALARAVAAGPRPPDALAGVAGRPLRCLLQVSLDGDSRRGGVPVTRLRPLAEQVASVEGLRLAGIMAVAPLGWEPERAFASLRELSGVVADVVPTATWISAGMSGDLEAAVAAGATHLRVGSAILGERPRLG